ncbi:hypothetical protein HD806DRAFT_533807 [Xylariaceae sp. AK1471]|nr:hypothetical protein HD806DRAFT_533807 [Xylariaceae sp. AK1471]
MNSPPRTAAVNSSEMFIGRFDIALRALDIVKSDAHRAWFLIGAAGYRRIQSYLPEDELAFVQHCESLVVQHFSLQSVFESPAGMRFYSRRITGFRYMQRLSRAMSEISETFRGYVKHLEENDEREQICATRKYRLHIKLKQWGYWNGLARGEQSPLRHVTSAEHRDLDELMEATDTISWEDYTTNRLGDLSISERW